MHKADSDIKVEFENFIRKDNFPCVAAVAALKKEQIMTYVAGNMACPKDDQDILNFIYEFTDIYRKSNENFFSAAVIFRSPDICEESVFEKLLWQRLQALAVLDADNFDYDIRVSDQPLSPEFSFSLKKEAFFIVGMNPASSRPSRKFKYSALIFNPHEQFTKLREFNRYDKMKKIVRQRDIVYSGSVNPMLDDFAEVSEAIQYSGADHNKMWKCPLKIRNS
jgi:FPC/CPF motif-containing protein YcgG